MKWAYYNEFDEYAAQWLRNLIKGAPRNPGVQAGEERSAADRLHCYVKTQV